MPLSSDGLRDLLITKFEKEFGKTPKKGRKSMERMATAIAEAIVTHFVENAKITVTVDATVTVPTSSSGLQRLPATFVANADTLGPATAKTLSGTGTGTGKLT
jgi:hypothetical protein